MLTISSALGRIFSLNNRGTQPNTMRLASRRTKGSFRQALASDDVALKLVCLRTGDSGKDATGIEDDPNLLGLIYAVPYQVFSPEFAFVVQGPDGVCGYILGARDTPEFYAEVRRDWFPEIGRASCRERV